jgi:hypothetical protein
MRILGQHGAPADLYGKRHGQAGPQQVPSAQRKTGDQQQAVYSSRDEITDHVPEFCSYLNDSVTATVTELILVQTRAKR